MSNDQASIEMFRFCPIQIKAICELYYLNGDFIDMMENLDILHSTLQQQRNISFASLNFSGINTNPFEYDDGSELFLTLNAHFQILFDLHLKEKKLDNAAKIDKAYKHNRLSVAYTDQFTLVDSKLPDRKEFEMIWF